MSHYDSGIHSYPGTTTVNLTLETYNKRIGACWKKRFNSEQNKFLSFFGGKFYIKSFESYLLIPSLNPSLEKFKLQLTSSGPINYSGEEVERLKKKYIYFSLNTQTDIIKANSYPGWVHDWVKSFCLDKEKRIWSEARDTIQNNESPYEVEWHQLYDYWCSDCHDEHTDKRILFGKFYKSKGAALKASKTLPKEIRGI